MALGTRRRAHPILGTTLSRMRWIRRVLTGLAIWKCGGFACEQIYHCIPADEAKCRRCCGTPSIVEDVPSAEEGPQDGDRLTGRAQWTATRW